MIIHLHTLIHNEIERLPFAIKYWKTFVSHVYVYLMKSSNDGSREYLQNLSGFVTIEEIDDPDGFNDKRNKLIKNTCWKKSVGIADFVIVNDFDEFIYSDNLINELQYMKDNGMTIVHPEIYHLINKDVNINELNQNEFLHKQIEYGVYDKHFGKRCIFDPNKITEINYTEGAHSCFPVGDVKYYDRKNIYLFHAKYLGIKWFISHDYKLKQRLSETNKKHGYGNEYTYDIETKVNHFLTLLKSKIFIGNI